jgi:phage virion morphogenesis protein
MAVTFTYNDRELTEAFKTLRNNVHDLSKPMRDIAVYMKEEVLENFEQEGRSKRWAPLSPKTKEIKEKKKGTTGKILEFHGRLIQSINLRSDKNEASVFTGVFYGVYHQTGTRKMPQRAFMPYDSASNIPPFDKEGLENIKSIMSDHLAKAANQNV